MIGPGPEEAAPIVAIGELDKPARTRLSAAERRTGILTAARREFARRGYQGASTSRIAANAGCSEPMLYKHFAGKQALFLAVLVGVGSAMEAQIDAVLARPGDPLEIWESTLPQLMSSPLYAEMVGLRRLAVTLADDDEVLTQLRDGTDRLLARTAQAVRRSQVLGTIRPEVDPEHVAWTWLGITLVGSYRSAVEGPDGFSNMLPHALTFLEGLRVQHGQAH